MWKVKAVDAKKKTLSITSAELKVTVKDLPVAEDATIGASDPKSVFARFATLKLADLAPDKPVAVELRLQKGKIEVADVKTTK